MSGLLDVQQIRERLNTRRVGSLVESINSTTSTNDAIWDGVSLPIDGYVLFAEQQTAGRGRMGRSWVCPRGAGLMFSVLLCGEDDTRPDGLYALSAAIACCDGIAAATDVRPLIQWPNDLYVGRRKLGGILVEKRRTHDGDNVHVIGVGINCLQTEAHFPGELRGRATSLDIESSQPVLREAVAASLLNALDEWLARPARVSRKRIREAWLARSAPLGQRIRLRHAGKEYVGCVVDLDPTAAIVVQLEHGGRRLFHADQTVIMDGAFRA